MVIAIHSALGLGINVLYVCTTAASCYIGPVSEIRSTSEKHLRNTELWASKATLIIDEISLPLLGINLIYTGLYMYQVRMLSENITLSNFRVVRKEDPIKVCSQLLPV
jgi:hypothetical protein